MKVCSKCEKEKSLDNYYKLNGIYYAMCNLCKAKYHRSRNAKIKKRIIRNQW
jgi:hypothetical protein